MTIEERIPLAAHTTFQVGGPARFFIHAKTVEDVCEAIVFARTQNLPLLLLGGGSNILASDAEIRGVVLKVEIEGTEWREDVGSVYTRVGAGVVWNELVDAATHKNVFGIENLAGIPGTVGGAAVQNIGAYGAELSEVVEYVEVIDTETPECVRTRLSNQECAFGYRNSIFKKKGTLVVVEVGFIFSKTGTPRATYPDLIKAKESGVELNTPIQIADAVRAIRARKFPDLSKEGTAGSFFKNPVVSAEKAAELLQKFPEMRQFPQKDGNVKISLAWILDHALSLKGFAHGNARLFENQPLVIAGKRGVTEAEVRALAEEVKQKVFVATGITIEREVESFGA